MELLGVSLMEMSENIHQKDRRHRMVVAWQLPFRCSIIVSITGQVFLFVANRLAGCVDNTGKIHFILAVDVGIPWNYVKRQNTLYQSCVYKLENVLANIKTVQLFQQEKRLLCPLVYIINMTTRVHLRHHNYIIEMYIICLRQREINN